MKNGTLKNETKRELNKLAEILHERLGEECYNLDNFIKLAVRIAYGEINLSHYTIRKESSQNYLIKKIKELETPPQLEEEIVVEEAPILQQTIYFYSDGTYQVEDHRIEQTEQLINSVMEDTEKKLSKMIDNYFEDVEIEEKRQWKGMFNYDDGKEVIRVGQYMGCDLTDKGSINKYFVDWKKGRSVKINLYGYVCHCLNPKELERIKKNWCGEKANHRDEEEHLMNIATLQKIKNRIEKTHEYPGVLALIRREKGLI